MFKKFTAISIALCFSALAQAEIWKDYTLSEPVTELVAINVKSTDVDDYLMNLEATWVAGMKVLMEMGVVIDYEIWVSNVSDSPKVFLTTAFKDMGAMQGSEERYNAMTAALEKMGMDEEENDDTSRGYEDIREVIDYKNLRQLTYK